ncbi:MAG: xylulokinase [Verrucomicrobiota bacterium]
MMSDVFIGIDSGTQSTKAIVLEGKNGKVLSEANATYGLIPHLPEGAKEQEPKTWVSAMERSIREAVRKSKIKPEQVKGIGVSGQQHGFVALDSDGNVIRPAKLWCDTSTSNEANSLIKKLGGPKKVIALGGNSIPAGFTASKIAWLKKKEPKNYAKLATVLLPHDYLNYYLTGGAITMEPGDASGTGLFDVKTRKWHSKLVRSIDPNLERKLPKIHNSSQPAGLLDSKVARKLGLSPGVVVSAGGGDNMMGAIGTGNTKVGVVTLSLGTSGTIYAYSARPTIDSLGQVAAFCDSTGAWLPLICTMNATVATELVKTVFKWTNDRLTKEAAKVPVGCGGLQLLPYFEGERVPNLPNGKGVYFGLDSTTFKPGYMARAAMEGVTFGLNYGLNRLRDLGIRPKQIRLTGGGSKNPVWRQIVADIFEAEVVALATAEGAALGAAIQAKWCYGLSRGENLRIQKITDAFVKTDPKTKCKPVKEHVKVYRPLQEMHNQLAQASAPLFDRLSNVR